MGTKSDFAEKLLHDLRLQKEKMAAAQNSSLVSREFHANAAAYRDAQSVTGPESGRGPNRGSRSFDLSESSNQIILKNSMALFSAFENTQKSSKITPPRNNPLLNFFTRLSRRPMSSKKTDANPSHVTEISTGIEKLNQILQSCSNKNHGFNRNSIDLEESLRMLVDLQEASDYINRLRPKDDRECLELTHKKISVEPPKFSFDKSKHKRSASCIPDFDSARKVEVKNEKGRISNVIAKLMGIEELPHKEENTTNKKDLSSSRGKERKILSNIETDVKDINRGVRAETIEPETRKMPKEMKLLEIQNAKGSVERLTLKEDKERKITELNNEMKQRVHQDSMIFLAKEKEKRSANKGAEPKRKDKNAPRTRVPEKWNVSEDMHRGGLKGKKKHKDHLVESLLLSKTRKKNEKATPDKGTATRMDGEAATTDGDPMIIKEGRNENLPPRKQSEDVEKTTIDVSSAVKSKGVCKENQKNENTRKMDLQMVRKSTENVNRLTRSLKQSADMLQDLKRQMQRKREDEQSERSEMSIFKADAVVEITKNDASRDERRTKNTQKVLAPRNSSNNIDSNPGNVSYDLQKVEDSCSSITEQAIKQSDLSIGGHKPTMISQNQLTECEKELKEIVIKSQEFINTAKAVFKLNIPPTLVHAGDDHTDKHKNERLMLDCAYEVAKRKAKRRNRARFHTYKEITALTSPKLRSLDDLIKLLSKDLETLTFRDEDEEGDIVGRLCSLLESDVYDKVPDANCMWDSEWGDMKLMLSGRDDVVRDLEKHVLNVLLNEITYDLLGVVS